jgi:hypothetical protein
MSWLKGVLTDVSFFVAAVLIRIDDTVTRHHRRKRR